MDATFATFLQGMMSDPILLITVILTLSVIFVNGWTDAPNAIATCITTRCMGEKCHFNECSRLIFWACSS